jgi:hypothetical protein
MKPTEAEIYDARGNRIAGDIVPDGGRVRVPMMFMDAEDVAEITHRALGDADDASDADDGIMHRPGYVRSKISDAIAKTQQVLRDDRLDKMQDAWKNPPPLQIKMDNDPAHSPHIKAPPQSHASTTPGRPIDIEAFHEKLNAKKRDAWKGAA